MYGKKKEGHALSPLIHQFSKEDRNLNLDVKEYYFRVYQNPALRARHAAQL